VLSIPPPDWFLNSLHDSSQENRRTGSAESADPIGSLALGRLRMLGLPVGLVEVSDPSQVEPFSACAHVRPVVHVLCAVGGREA
jgi:hypothetical protein